MNRKAYVHSSLLALMLLAGSAAQAKQDFGVNSVKQPVVTDGKATVPGCPDFTTAPLDSAALNGSNYGCAINSNLAAMIADPQDLLHGKANSDTDAAAIGRAIKAFREYEPTSKQWSVTTRESSKGGGK
jgi:pilus assembly protein CpaD